MMTKIFAFFRISVVDEVSERQIVQSHQLAPRASSATKELDDLMASLSDFKVSALKTFLPF